MVSHEVLGSIPASVTFAQNPLRFWADLLRSERILSGSAQIWADSEWICSDLSGFWPVLLRSEWIWPVLIRSAQIWWVTEKYCSLRAGKKGSLRTLLATLGAPYYDTAVRWWNWSAKRNTHFKTAADRLAPWLKRRCSIHPKRNKRI